MLQHLCGMRYKNFGAGLDFWQTYIPRMTTIYGFRLRAREAKRDWRACGEPVGLRLYITR